MGLTHIAAAIIQPGELTLPAVAPTFPSNFMTAEDVGAASFPCRT